MAKLPVLGGYKQLLSDQDFGFYVEHITGYFFGGTDKQKYNDLEAPFYKSNGNVPVQNLAGPGAGMGFGYLFQPSVRFHFKICLRVQHAFVSGDLSLKV